MARTWVLQVALLVAAALSVLVVDAATNMPTPSLTTNTVPFLQWKHTVDHNLQRMWTSRSSAAGVFNAASGSDGTGLFLVGGASASRRRAFDGGPSWVKSLGLPDESVCQSPYLPPGQADHLYLVCSPNVVAKLWWDTGVVQFAVNVFANHTVPTHLPNETTTTTTSSTLPPVPNLTQIVGLSHAYQPPALLVASASEGVLLLIDSRSGDFLGSFVPSFSAFQPQPSSPFTSLTSMRGFIADPASSQTVIVVAEASSQRDSKTVESLIAFRVQLPSLTIDGGFWVELIPDLSVLGAHTITLSTRTRRLFVRTADSFFMISNTASWSVALDAATDLALEAQILESADGRFVIPSVLSASDDSTLVLSGLDTTANPPVIVTIADYSAILDPSEAPFQLLVDSSSNVVFISSKSLSASPLTVAGGDGPQLVWSYSYFEDATSTVLSFASQDELSRISSVELLPDMVSGGSMVLVRTLATPDATSETIFAFNTRDSPSCEQLAGGDRDTCGQLTGQTTARQCVFCEASQLCAQSDACPASASHKRKVGLIIGSIMFAVLGCVLLFFFSLRKRKANQPRAYQAMPSHKGSLQQDALEPVNPLA